MHRTPSTARTEADTTTTTGDQFISPQGTIPIKRTLYASGARAWKNAGYTAVAAAADAAAVEVTGRGREGASGRMALSLQPRAGDKQSTD